MSLVAENGLHGKRALSGTYVVAGFWFGTESPEGTWTQVAMISEESPQYPEGKIVVTTGARPVCTSPLTALGAEEAIQALLG